MPCAPALVLFDIDGTLIRRAGPQHREALVEAVRRVTGLDTTTDGIPLQGMLDPDILNRMMSAAGANRTAIRRALPEVIRAAQAIYEGTCPVLDRKVCPGAKAALRRLEKRGVLMGLVTGNLTGIAWKKMAAAGLNGFFRFGAFSETAPTRAALARLAVRRARREGWVHRNAPVSLIGDHPNDIAAAKLNGIRSIAVATGVVAAGELARHAPDLLLPDLRALEVDMVL